MSIYGHKALSIVKESSVEDDSMTLKKAEKWYNQLLKSCKSHSEKKEDIKQEIKVLKQCKSNMEKELMRAKSNVGHDGRIKYTLKALIPFNGIYRAFKYGDWVPAIPSIVDYGVEFVVRFATYRNMLQRMINNTNESINFLQNKLKEL